jgi:hypothetical protein
MHILKVALMIEEVQVEQPFTWVSAWYHGRARNSHQYVSLQHKKSILLQQQHVVLKLYG